MILYYEEQSAAADHLFALQNDDKAEMLILSPVNPANFPIFCADCQSGFVNVYKRE